MAYGIAWGIYLVMAVLLLAGYERYLAPHLPRGWRIGLRALVAIGLFTPGAVAADGNFYLVPACVGVMFNILAKSGPGLMKALLPLLLSTAVVFGGLFVWEWRRQRAAAGGGGSDDDGTDTDSGDMDRKTPTL